MTRQQFAAWLAAGSLLLAFAVPMPAHAEFGTPDPICGDDVDPDGLEGLHGNPTNGPGLESADMVSAPGATESRRVSVAAVLRMMQILGF